MKYLQASICHWPIKAREVGKRSPNAVFPNLCCVLFVYQLHTFGHLNAEETHTETYHLGHIL